MARANFCARETSDIGTLTLRPFFDPTKDLLLCGAVVQDVGGAFLRNKFQGARTLQFEHLQSGH